MVPTSAHIDPRRSSSATLRGRRLELDNVGAEVEFVRDTRLNFLMLPFGSVTLLLVLQTFLELGVGLHLGLVGSLVSEDELLLLAVLLGHERHLELHGAGLDHLGAGTEHDKVVAGERVEVIVHVGVSERLDETNQDTAGLQGENLALDGLVGFLEEAELVLARILQDVGDQLHKDVKAGDNLVDIVRSDNFVEALFDLRLSLTLIGFHLT